jgi:hemolysin activation/secretion protein
MRSRISNLTVRGTFSYHNGQTDVGPARLTTDRIRAARVGLAWDSIDALRGINLVDLELSQGLNVSGATDRSPSASRANAPADFQKMTLYAARLQSLAPKWSVLAAMTGQYAFSNLLAPEQFAFGGEQFGRAYDAAELLADHGLAFKAELRFNDRGAGALRDYMVYGFYDTGQVRRRNPQAGETKSQSAQSVGAGIRFNIQGNVNGYVEGAIPNRVVAAEGRKVSRLFAGIQVNF